MKITLLTGLDGAGKSTFFTNLRSLSKTTGFLNLPHIDYYRLPKGLLKEAAEWVTLTNREADRTKDVALKSFALFCSMLLFDRLLAVEKTSGSHIITERHPLIDTQVYARFYASRLAPDHLDQSALEDCYLRNKRVIDLIVKDFEWQHLQGEGNTVFKTLEFIHQWFHLDKKYSSTALQSVFPIELPDEVYYLRADSDTLMERLGGRSEKEAHETKETLEKFDQVYLGLLQTEQIPYTVIDTSGLSAHETQSICHQILGLT